MSRRGPRRVRPLDDAMFALDPDAIELLTASTQEASDDLVRMSREAVQRMLADRRAE